MKMNGNMTKNDIENRKKKSCFLKKNSRPIDVNRNSDSPNADMAVEKVLQTLDIKTPLQKRYRDAQRDNLKVLLLDLYVARLQGQHVWLGFPRKTSNQHTDRFADKGLSGGTIMNLVDAMARQAYVKTELGYYDFKTRTGKQSRVQASDHLFDILLKNAFNPEMLGIHRKPEIILREKDDNGNKVDIPVPDTALTRIIRADIQRVNIVLEQADIQLVSCKVAHPDFRLSLLGPRYYRVFNEDFEHGGRWYGHGCLSILKGQRKHIHINGEPTVELDFISLHPRMAYDLENVPAPDGDLYTYPGSKPGEARKVRKILFNTLLNAKSEEAGYGGAVKSLAEDHGIFVTQDEIKSISGHLKAYHAPIKHHFGTGLGLRLQFLDSEIARCVLLDLADAGIPCLPVHDSFVVAQQNEAHLHELMVYHYRIRMGSSPIITREQGV